MSEKIRVALADDHPIVLAGLRNLIEAESDFELVGQGTSGHSALKMIRDKLPDVAIVDISMPEINGIALARRLAEECLGVRVLILTLYEDRSFLKQALAAGVRGYVLKRSAAENLVHAIRAVQLGKLYIDPSLLNELRGRYSQLNLITHRKLGRSWTDRPRSKRPQIFGARINNEGNCRPVRIECQDGGNL